MIKDLELRIQIDYGDVTVERQISSKTDIRIKDINKLTLTEKQIIDLYKALTAYVKADGIEV
jgi:hypothetical protein